MADLIQAKGNYIGIAPRKAQLVANQLRHLSIDEALNILKFSHKKAAYHIGKVLKSAVSNAKRNHTIDLDQLVVSKITVNGGPTSKRFLCRAQGRATRIRHRTSHIHVVLAEV